MSDWKKVDGTLPQAYPVIPKLEILEAREVRKEVKDVPVFERIG